MIKKNEDLKQEAYKIALSFKKSDLVKEVIYATLEKLGFPKDVANEVANNIVVQRNSKNGVFNYNKLAVYTSIIGLALASLVFVISGSFSKSFYLFFSIIGITFLFQAITSKD